MQEQEARLGRVENEVGTMRSEMGSLTNDVAGLKADVKGLGNILGRIEQGVLRAQEKTEEKEDRNKPNLIALVSILITIITIIVGGAWTISGNLSKQDERAIAQKEINNLFIQMRNREADTQNGDIRRLEDQIRKMGDSSNSRGASL